MTCKRKYSIWNIPNDRFKSVISNDFRQYVATFIYIMENPVKAKIVERPQDFEYNGINFMKKGWYEAVNPPDLVIMLLVPGIVLRALPDRDKIHEEQNVEYMGIKLNKTC